MLFRGISLSLKFEVNFLKIGKMDLIRRLTLLNHRQVLQEESETRFPISEKDSPEEIELYESLRISFKETYDKENNRQFVKTKMYHMNEYRLSSEVSDEEGVTDA